MVATHRMSITEFADVPLEGTWELIDGEPVERSPSAGESGWIAGEILGLLREYLRLTKLGWVFPSEVGFVLFAHRDTVRSPDVAFVRHDRLEKPPRSFVPLAPDFAVEVLSPSDRQADALSKVAMYLQAGVHLDWLVDPAKRTVTVFRPDESIAIAPEGDDLDGGEVIPGFRLSVAEVFG